MENLVPACVDSEEGLPEVSPEISKSAKRFKFSPGMVDFHSLTCLDFYYFITITLC